ncbi:alpha/beta fold hydrolase [Micromonosporaceae bacterium Da 78-11]
MATRLRPGPVTHPPEFADIPGARIAYRTWGGDPDAQTTSHAWGSPDVPAVVWLHGASGDGTTWAEIAPTLPVRSHALDRRGYGASSRFPAAEYGPAAEVDDIIGLLDVLGLDRAVIAGHSAGGVVAWRTAVTFPARVAALILEECPAPLPHDLHPVHPDGEPDYDWAARLSILTHVNNPDPTWWDDLTRIEAPTLVIAGGPTSHFAQDEIHRMAAQIPGSELRTIKAGHAVHANQPAAFTSVVTTFLAAALTRR